MHTDKESTTTEPEHKMGLDIPVPIRPHESDVIYNKRKKIFSSRHAGNREIIDFGTKVIDQDPVITNEDLQERIFGEVTSREPPGRFLSHRGKTEIHEITDYSAVDKILKYLIREIRQATVNSPFSASLPDHGDELVHDNDVIFTHSSKNRLAAKHPGTMQVKDLILNRVDLEGKPLVKFIRNEVSKREPPGRFYFYNRETNQFLIERQDKLITRILLQFVVRIRQEEVETSNSAARATLKDHVNVHDNDVLCDFILSDQVLLHHSGTKLFIEFSKDLILNSLEMDENSLIECIRDEVIKRNPPGRFLHYDTMSKHYAVLDDDRIVRRIRHHIGRLRGKPTKDSYYGRKNRPKLDPSEINDNDVIWHGSRADRLMISHPGTLRFHHAAQRLPWLSQKKSQQNILLFLFNEVTKREPPGRFLLFDMLKNHYQILDNVQINKKIRAILKAKESPDEKPKPAAQNAHTQSTSKLSDAHENDVQTQSTSKLSDAHENDVLIHFSENRLILSHSGTQQFLDLAKDLARNRHDILKKDLVKCIRDEVNRRNPPGRFLYFVEEFRHYKMVDEMVIYKKIFHIITQTRKWMKLEETSKSLSAFETVVEVHKNDVLYTNRRLDVRHPGSRRCREICEALLSKHYGDLKQHYVEKIVEEIMRGDPPNRFIHHDVKTNRYVLLDKKEIFRKIRPLLWTIDDKLRKDKESENVENRVPGAASDKRATEPIAVSRGSKTVNCDDVHLEQQGQKQSGFQLRDSDVLYKGRGLNIRHPGSVVFREWCENFIIENFELLREAAIARTLDMVANQQPPGRFVLYCEKKKEYEVMNDDLVKKKVFLFIKGFKQRYRQKREIQSGDVEKSNKIVHDQAHDPTQSPMKAVGAITGNGTHETSRKRKFDKNSTGHEIAQRDSEQAGKDQQLGVQAIETKQSIRNEKPQSGVFTEDQEALRAAKSLRTLFNSTETVRGENQVLHRHPTDALEENENMAVDSKVPDKPLSVSSFSRKHLEGNSKRRGDGKSAEMDSNDEKSQSDESSTDDSSTDDSSTDDSSTDDSSTDDSSTDGSSSDGSSTDGYSTDDSFDSTDIRLDGSGSVGRPDIVPSSVISSMVVDHNHTVVPDTAVSGTGLNQVLSTMPRSHRVAAATMEQIAQQVCQKLQQASLTKSPQSRSHGDSSTCVKDAVQEAEQLLQKIMLRTQEDDFESAQERDQYMSIFHMLENALDECIQSGDHTKGEGAEAEGADDFDEDRKGKRKELNHKDMESDDEIYGEEENHEHQNDEGDDQDRLVDWEENLPRRSIKEERL